MINELRSCNPNPVLIPKYERLIFIYTILPLCFEWNEMKMPGEPGCAVPWWWLTLKSWVPFAMASLYPWPWTPTFTSSLHLLWPVLGKVICGSILWLLRHRGVNDILLSGWFMVCILFYLFIFLVKFRVHLFFLINLFFFISWRLITLQ